MILVFWVLIIEKYVNFQLLLSRLNANVHY